METGFFVASRQAKAYRTFKKQKTRYQLSRGSGFVEVVLRLLSSTCQRRKQVRQPATVVVVPISNVAVNFASKHCSGLITDGRSCCQMYSTLVPVCEFHQRSWWIVNIRPTPEQRLRHLNPTDAVGGFVHTQPLLLNALRRILQR